MTRFSFMRHWTGEVQQDGAGADGKDGQNGAGTRRDGEGAGMDRTRRGAGGRSAASPAFAGQQRRWHVAVVTATADSHSRGSRRTGSRSQDVGATCAALAANSADGTLLR